MNNNWVSMRKSSSSKIHVPLNKRIGGEMYTLYVDPITGQQMFTFEEADEITSSFKKQKKSAYSFVVRANRSVVYVRS